MKKKFLIGGAILFLIVTGCYLFIRYRYLKVPDFQPDTSKVKNAVDLRPAIIAKLQQTVKDASNGLYILTIDKVEPNLLSSKLDIFNAAIQIDTSVMRDLDKRHLLPDDIFRIKFSTLHIDGIGIQDLLSKDRIGITGIRINKPIIDVYHKKRFYNEQDRKRTDTLTLYEKLKGQLQKIAIGKIEILNGTFINHDMTKVHTFSKFNDVSVLINDLLIDSSTQYDKSRFLFAKHVKLRTQNYSIPTSDSLYFFTVGDLSVAGEQQTITALNVQLKPRYNRQRFLSKLKYGKDMYIIVLPRVILKNINWPALINNEKIVSDQAEITGGSFKIFFDRAKSQGPLKLNNFPHQALMQLPVPVSIRKFNIRDVDLSYEEHNPLTGKNGTVFFDKVNAQINNVTNISSEIKKQPYSTLSASALLMHHVPINVGFKFNLLKHRTGEFIADVKVNSFDSVTINPIAAPLGLFKVKTGKMQKATVHVEGNNLKANGNITMHYNDLNITPLKKDEDGGLRKKTVIGLLANVILIKNENPKDGELRQPSFTVERKNHKNFFNLLWHSILLGVVKTIGIPDKFAEKK